MAALTDLSDLVNRSTGGNSGTPQNVFFHKVARIAGAAPPATIAGRWHSLWTYDGYPAGGSAPGAVAAPTSATTGALPFTSPGGGRESWLTQAWATGLVGGTLVLYDRLLHISGLSGTVTTAQTVGGTLTRNNGGVGNMAMAEIYSIIGTTGTTITMSYTNQAGTSGRTSTATSFGATNFREQTRAVMLPLQAGDTGIQAVASTTVLATTGTAGNFGITVFKPLAYIGIGAPGAPGWRDFVTGLPGIPEIETGACLGLLWSPTTTTAPEVFGGYAIVEA
jgi:hypothetical protein